MDIDVDIDINIYRYVFSRLSSQILYGSSSVFNILFEGKSDISK